MNFSIKGKLNKVHSSWNVEIPILDFTIYCSRPLLCFQELEKSLRIELKDENLKCFFKIDDHGVFYLITAQTPEFVEFISERLLDLDGIKLEPNLE